MARVEIINSPLNVDGGGPTVKPGRSTLFGMGDWEGSLYMWFGDVGSDGVRDMVHVHATEEDHRPSNEKSGT
jgi:hypothetical protein